MAKQVYIAETVEIAVRKRIAYIFDNFENIVVSISGGKDSTVMCWLALQEAIKRKRKIGIFFLDEEAVYQSTINQVEWLMNLYPENTIRMWYQIPFCLTNSTSLSEGQMVCWEPGRSDIWMRSKVPYAIKAVPWDKKFQTVRNKNKGFGFYDVLDNFQASKDHTAFLIGLRATESMNRFRAVAKNPGFEDCYWCTKINTNIGNVSFYPMYDFNFHDIWKFIYDHNIKYSKIYDWQFKKGFAQQDIRVSSLIHEKSFKALVDLPEFEPSTYDKLLKRVKGIEVGHLYGKDSKLLKCRSLPKNFNSWVEYKDFLLSTYPDHNMKEVFIKRFSKHLNNNYVARQQCRQLILNDYENNLAVINKEDPRNQTIEKWRDLL